MAIQNPDAMPWAFMFFGYNFHKICGRKMPIIMMTGIRNPQLSQGMGCIRNSKNLRVNRSAVIPLQNNYASFPYPHAPGCGNGTRKGPGNHQNLLKFLYVHRA